MAITTVLTSVSASNLSILARAFLLPAYHAVKWMPLMQAGLRKGPSPHSGISFWGALELSTPAFEQPAPAKNRKPAKIQLEDLKMEGEGFIRKGGLSRLKWRALFLES